MPLTERTIGMADPTIFLSDPCWKYLLRRSPNSAYFVVLNDREIRHFVILFAAGYALFHGRISKSGSCLSGHGRG